MTYSMHFSMMSNIPSCSAVLDIGLVRELFESSNLETPMMLLSRSEIAAQLQRLRCAAKASRSTMP
jgi:hypothetical protein